MISRSAILPRELSKATFPRRVLIMKFLLCFYERGSKRGLWRKNFIMCACGRLLIRRWITRVDYNLLSSKMRKFKIWILMKGKLKSCKSWIKNSSRRPTSLKATSKSRARAQSFILACLFFYWEIFLLSRIFRKLGKKNMLKYSSVDGKKREIKKKPSPKESKRETWKVLFMYFSKHKFRLMPVISINAETQGTLRSVETRKLSIICM